MKKKRASEPLPRWGMTGIGKVWVRRSTSLSPLVEMAGGVRLAGTLNKFAM